MTSPPIHPFPARMAPEIIVESLASLPRGSVVLDPMCGSGTVLRASVELGLSAVGFDLDPLAVLMSKVWSTRSATGISRSARELVENVRDQPYVMPDWHRSCSETQTFVDFWFEERQRRDLSKLAVALSTRNDEDADALRLALSRIIVTKEKGASVARDTSHSRPHRVFYGNDFDVFRNFVVSAQRIEDRVKSDLILGTSVVSQGDARCLPLPDNSVDAVITSPPYLNAIDYLRGHRLALVWLGHNIKSLRSIRSDSIGAEAARPDNQSCLIDEIEGLEELGSRDKAIVNRYAHDIEVFMAEVRRVLRPAGKVLLVVGDSNIKNVNIPNAEINHLAALGVGLSFAGQSERDLPANNRYLPMTVGDNALSKRMRTETVLTFTG